MCAGNKNLAAQKQSGYTQMLQDQKFLNSAALHYSKGAQFKKGNDAAVVGYSRDIGDAQAKALEFAGNARLSKAVGYAKYQQQKGRYSAGKDALNKSRTASRNAFLAMAAQNRQIEYSVDQTFGLGMQNAETAANRTLASNRDKLLASKGMRPIKPHRIPMPKGEADIMGTFNKIKTIGAIGAAPFTGGASLKLIGLGGTGSGGKWDLFA